MIKRILQSPIFNALVIFIMGLILLGEYYGEYVPDWLTLHPLFLFIPIILLLSFIPLHNRKDPKNKIKLSFIPMEFSEEDEGLQWITFKATRKVYILFSLLIPIAILVTALFKEMIYLPMIILMVMGIAQYLIFWLEIKKHR